MTDAKPKALQLVEESENGDWIVGTGQWREEAAAELRRLHEENTALRQAIEQAEKQEPVAWMYKGNFHDFDPSEWASPEFVVTPLYTAPPKREQEPVNTMPTKIVGPNLEQILNAAGFYKREWVGLTDEDTANICMQSDINNWHDEQVIDAVEAKLKEKNGG